MAEVDSCTKSRRSDMSCEKRRKLRHSRWLASAGALEISTVETIFFFRGMLVARPRANFLPVVLLLGLGPRRLQQLADS